MRLLLIATTFVMALLVLLWLGQRRLMYLPHTDVPAPAAVGLADVGAYHYPMLPVRLLLRDRFAVLDRIAQVRAPLLVIAGDADRIVPIEQSRRVHDAARSPKTFTVIEGADHNDAALTAGPQVVAETMRLPARLP